MHSLIRAQHVQRDTLARQDVALLGSPQGGPGLFGIAFNHAAGVKRQLQFQPRIEIVDRVGMVQVARSDAQSRRPGELIGAKVVERGIALGQLEAEGAEGIVGACQVQRGGDFGQTRAGSLPDSGFCLADLCTGSKDVRILQQGSINGLFEIERFRVNRLTQSGGQCPTQRVHPKDAPLIRLHLLLRLRPVYRGNVLENNYILFSCLISSASQVSGETSSGHFVA